MAERWRYVDGGGEVGVISSVTQAFCATCTRAALDRWAIVYVPVRRERLRSQTAGARRGPMTRYCDAMSAIWQQRADRYSEIRTAETAKGRKVEMSFIGGKTIGEDASRAVLVALLLRTHFLPSASAR